MKRSAGVTLIAILSLLGSGFTLTMGLVMLAMVIFVPPGSNPFPASPGLFKAILFAGALMYLLPAAWGIITGVGLWRLKNWARISIIVFSVLLILTAGFSGLITLVVPFPPPPQDAANPALMTTVRVFIGVFWLILLGIGVWWVTFFNRSKVKEQFLPVPDVYATGPTTVSAVSTDMPEANFAVGPAAPAVSKRPLSITIIAWLLLAGCVSIPWSLVLRAPAFLFTRVLTGWPASLFYLAFAAVQLVIGVGLLRLRTAARPAAIFYYIFLLVNSVVFYFAPGGRGRLISLMESQRSMFPWMGLVQSRPEFYFDPTRFLVIGAAAGLIVTTIPVYFLISRRVAFEKAVADSRLLGSGA